MSKIKLLISSLIFSASLIFVDQLSKYLIRHLGGFYLCNSGIAWNIKIPFFIFWTIWIGIIFFIIYLIARNILQENRLCLFSFSLLLILSGGLSNFIDRVFLSCIVDFINLKIWPVFNLADSFITIGVILLLFSELKKNSNSKF